MTDNQGIRWEWKRIVEKHLPVVYLKSCFNVKACMHGKGREGKGREFESDNK